jgi:hypothetical protein
MTQQLNEEADACTCRVCVVGTPLNDGPVPTQEELDLHDSGECRKMEQACVICGAHYEKTMTGYEE